jgi:hypothetical protein
MEDDVSEDSEYCEEMTQHVIEKHGLKHIHFFAEKGLWRAFGARTNANGFQESVADASGESITQAVMALDRRLTLGPIKGRAPWDNAS